MGGTLLPAGAPVIAHRRLVEGEHVRLSPEGRQFEVTRVSQFSATLSGKVGPSKVVTILGEDIDVETGERVVARQFVANGKRAILNVSPCAFVYRDE
jgi:sulfate adenylyltransferase subunit 1 (EFTu-like GTPase family)